MPDHTLTRRMLLAAGGAGAVIGLTGAKPGRLPQAPTITAVTGGDTVHFEENHPREHVIEYEAVAVAA